MSKKPDLPTLEHIPEPGLLERYSRRVHLLEYTRPTQPFSRYFQLGTLLVTAATAGYVVLYVDFGPDDHCFVPVRNWFERKKAEFWRLSNKEKQELKEQGKL